MFNKMIIRKIYYYYAKFFAKNIFSKFNKLLFNVSLRGLGVFNYQNSRISGEQKFLENYLSKLASPVIFDVGANKGEYTSRCICINKHARVYAFEPHPKTFEILKRSVSDKCVVVVNKAISNSKGKMQLYDYKNNEGSVHASLCKGVIEKVHKGDGISCDVEVVTLDEFVKENKINKIHLLKIDVEGNEMNVLKGAKDSIKNGIVDVIQFEFTQINSVSRVFMKDYFDLLETNYSLYRLLPNGLLSLGEYTPTSHEIYGYQNIVAIRKE